MMKRTMSKLFELPGEDEGRMQSNSSSSSSSCKQGDHQLGKKYLTQAQVGGIVEALSSVRDDKAVTRDCCRKLLLIDKPSSPTSVLLRRYGAGGASHFLKACYLCKKDIAAFDQDIYMYMCKTFCSTACRHQQMFTDESSTSKKPRQRPVATAV